MESQQKQYLSRSEYELLEHVYNVCILPPTCQHLDFELRSQNYFRLPQQQQQQQRQCKQKQQPKNKMTVFEESVIAKTADWKFLFKIIYLYENAELTYFFLTTSKSLRQVRDPDFFFLA